jgi:hypothetical protein
VPSTPAMSCLRCLTRWGCFGPPEPKREPLLEPWPSALDSTSESLVQKVHQPDGSILVGGTPLRKKGLFYQPPPPSTGKENAAKASASASSGLHPSFFSPLGSSSTGNANNNLSSPSFMSPGFSSLDHMYGSIFGRGQQ